MNEMIKEIEEDLLCVEKIAYETYKKNGFITKMDIEIFDKEITVIISRSKAGYDVTWVMNEQTIEKTKLIRDIYFKKLRIKK